MPILPLTPNTNHTTPNFTASNFCRVSFKVPRKSDFHTCCEPQSNLWRKRSPQSYKFHSFMSRGLGCSSCCDFWPCWLLKARYLYLHLLSHPVYKDPSMDGLTQSACQVYSHFCWRFGRLGQKLVETWHHRQGLIP